MSWILRTSSDLANPTLPGGIYGRFITIGMPVYYRYDGTQTKGIIFIGDGGKYGLDSIQSVEYKGAVLTPTTNWIFHRGTLSTGFADTEQGLPTFCPEVATTFNNIAYIEFALPTGVSSATDQPDWSGFRIIGTGRRMMDYNGSGKQTGFTTDPTLLQNVALHIADNYLVNFKGKPARIDWTSWYALRNSAGTWIWQRTSQSDDKANPTGLAGEYFSDTTFTTSVVKRLDSQINFSFGTNAPAPGVPTTNYSVRWIGKVLPRYSETYTFTLAHSGHGKVIVNGTTVIDNAVAGTHTGTISLTANTLYSIQVETTLATGSGSAILSWQSTSQAVQIIPTGNLLPPDVQVQRYATSIAFAGPTEAADVHETLMQRCPGWDWTDIDGKITFLDPNRSAVVTFMFDKGHPTRGTTLVKNTLQKKRRALSDRKNFRLYRFRNIEYTGYPFSYTSIDRDTLRKYTSGVPTNDNAEDLGVITRSLAQRMGEMAMVMGTDPDHTVNLAGTRAMTGVRKSQFVLVTVRDWSNRTVTSGIYMVTFASWGARNERMDFSAIPIMPASGNYYTDEPA